MISSFIVDMRSAYLPGICCCRGSCQLTAVVPVLLPVWLLALDCSWLCCCTQGYFSRLSSGSAPRCRGHVVISPLQHPVVTSKCTFPVATHCASPSQPPPRSGVVIRRNCVCKSTLQRDEEYIEANQQFLWGGKAKWKYPMHFKKILWPNKEVDNVIKYIFCANLALWRKKDELFTFGYS